MNRIVLRAADCGLRLSVTITILFVGSLPRVRLLRAQRIHQELGVEAYTLLASPDRVGGALYAAQRVGPRTRVSLLTGVDDGAGGMAGRVEGLVHFLLAPDRKTGTGIYAAGGLAADIAERTDARIVALVGIEAAPGGRSGWVLEAGVGGGWRFAAGWRWRR